MLRDFPKGALGIPMIDLFLSHETIDQRVPFSTKRRLTGYSVSIEADTHFQLNVLLVQLQPMLLGEIPKIKTFLTRFFVSLDRYI